MRNILFFALIFTFCGSVFVACDNGSDAEEGYDFEVVEESSSSVQ